MPAGGLRRSRTAVLSTLLAFVALLLFAHAPLLRAGLFPWDYAELLSGRSPASPWSLNVLLAHELPAPGSTAMAWRLEPLLVLVGLALAVRAFLVRLLEPRIGSHAARAAALVAALLIPLHPAAPAATAELAALNEVLALLLGFCAGALFLRGRQEERDVLTAAALVLLVLAGSRSPVAILLALGFAAAEFASVRRHRRRSLRIRTAATTALLFGAGAALPLLSRAARVPDGAPSAELSFGDELREQVLHFSTELGRSTASSGAGALAAVLAGALLLLALQPAFRAARNAPRLWGGVLASWSVALLGALAWASTGESGGRLLALIVWSAGLGLTITALARPWRAGLAATIALGWSILAHAGARPWLAGSAALARLHGEITALAPPRDARVLVLDPPAIEGLPPLTRDLGWVFHWALDPAADESEFDPRRVQGLSSAAFLALTRSDAFASLRAEPLVVLAPVARPGRGRAAMRVPAARPASTQPASWRGALKFAPEMPLDPLKIEQVRIVAELASLPREIECLAWRTPAAEAERAGDSGSCEGLVRERSGRRVAEFDLGQSLAWRLTGSVAALLVKNGVREIERGELLARLPAIPGAEAPRIAGGDWCVAEPRLDREREPGARFVLGLLALDDLERLELPLEPDPAGSAGELRARGAQLFVASKARADAPVVWELEYRVGEQALFRSRGSVP